MPQRRIQPDLRPDESGVFEDPSQPRERNRDDDDCLLRERGIRASVGSRHHRGLANGPREGQVRRELHDLVAAQGDDEGHGKRTHDRLERQPWTLRHHVVEQRRV